MAMTNIVNPEQSVSRLNAIHFVDGPVWSHICHDQRIITTST